ncbi:MAG TPA: hypothetical protein VF730_04110 [Terracidiphilus sp.]
MLDRLIEIERAIGVVDSLSLRKMVVEAQEVVLQAQKQAIQDLRQRATPPIPADSTQRHL